MERGELQEHTERIKWSIARELIQARNLEKYVCQQLNQVLNGNLYTDIEELIIALEKMIQDIVSEKMRLPDKSSGIRIHVVKPWKSPKTNILYGHHYGKWQPRHTLSPRQMRYSYDTDRAFRSIESEGIFIPITLPRIWKYILVISWIPKNIQKYAFNIAKENLANLQKWFVTIDSWNKDPLTWAYNRAYEERLAIRLDTEQKAYAVITFDLDKFKPINDQFWHGIWDEVLKAFVWYLQEVIFKRTSDKVVRKWGDEFAVIVELNQNPSEPTLSVQVDTLLTTINERIRTNPLACKHTYENDAGELTIKIGFTFGHAYNNGKGEVYIVTHERADRVLIKEKKRKGSGR